MGLKSRQPTEREGENRNLGMAAPAVGIEACPDHPCRSSITTSIFRSASHLATRTRLACLCVFCYCQWVFLSTVVASYFAPEATDAGFSSSSGGRGVQEGVGSSNARSVVAGGGSSSGVAGGGGGATEGFHEELVSQRRPPRILTVLTTYGKRSSFVKPYKETILDRNDGYRPTVNRCCCFVGCIKA